jgi:hypothetical protein
VALAYFSLARESPTLIAARTAILTFWAELDVEFLDPYAARAAAAWRAGRTAEEAFTAR